ncbi:MAG: UvrD-helicase domain-containing protein, partial [Sphingomicrobium sp.]
MAGGTKIPPTLDPDQALATDPRAHAALSASAGTGKTHVLTSRVFRLLLGGAAPETILGLTFTKAAAANMAERIGTRLASWVRMDRYALAAELQALGERGDEEQRAFARTLFARVLDAPGGIRVMTIHAFAQSLLAAFPAEAGIMPGFQQIEGRAQQELQHHTLADLLVEAERSGNRELIDDVERLSQRLGETGAVKYLAACAARADRLERFNPATIEAVLRCFLGVPEGAIEAVLAQRCGDEGIDCELLRELAGANRDWGTASGTKQADVIEQFLAADDDGRVGMAGTLMAVFRTEKGTVRKASTGLLAHRADYEDAAERLADALGEVLDLRRSAAAAADMASGLRAGRAYAVAYNRAKRAQGVADFSDLIAWTRDLLAQDGIGAWVRFKLDRRIDHILVDEAQDTNADQWAIVDGLVDDFFSGAPEAEERQRTLLIVGDFKQAIFRFQGTDPREFEQARLRYRGRAEALIQAEIDSGTMERRALPFHDLGMNRSFRSAQGVLDVVDGTIAAHGWDLMGLPSEPLPHVAAKRDLAGLVELWSPFELVERESEGESGTNDGEETWVDLRERKYADALALEIKRLIDSGTVLGSTGRPVSPGDILVLVRSRRSLSALIVARLFEAGVRVGGVDRLQLHAPLAVQDLLAAMRFAVQPLDDLNLACLLVSPLIGWSQERLMD